MKTLADLERLSEAAGLDVFYVYDNIGGTQQIARGREVIVTEPGWTPGDAPVYRFVVTKTSPTPAGAPIVLGALWDLCEIRG